MQRHDQALNAAIKRVERLRKKVEDENKKFPVNQGLVSSLQADLPAPQAKQEGERMTLVNQRAIITLVGEENMTESFLEAVDGGVAGPNRQGFRNFGASFRGLGRPSGEDLDRSRHDRRTSGRCVQPEWAGMSCSTSQPRLWRSWFPWAPS
jgi:hypothetical protein